MSNQLNIIDMKKLLAVMVLVLGAIVVNAQRTPVKVSDLPKGVADSIQKEYSGYTIKESNKVIQNNTTTYEVVVSKGSQQKTLMFDNQGKSLKHGTGTMDMDKSMDKSKSNSWDNDKSSTDKSKTTTPSESSSPSSTPSSSGSTTYPSSGSSTTPSSSPSSSPSSTPSSSSTNK
jgi:hypothetical protein